LQDTIALADGAIGWCGLSADGKLRVTLLDATADMNRIVILFDGAPLGTRPQCRRHDGAYQRAIFTLPELWRQAGSIAVCLKGQALFGSPIDAASISRVEGFVSAQDGGLSGWAWFPHDPDCGPTLTVRDANGHSFRIAASESAPHVVHARPLARPRLLDVPTGKLRGFVAPIAVLDASGRNLYGSPLDPLADIRSAAGAAELARQRFPASPHTNSPRVDLPLPAVPADIIGIPQGGKRSVRAPGIDVVVPAYRGAAQTMACLQSVLATLPSDARCIVVEDASPDSGLVTALQDLAAQGRILLFRQPENRGFPATANVGIRAAGGRDVILLNSDTIVPPGWVERLADAAYSAPDIGSATPISNDATIFSYPRTDIANPLPAMARTVALDRLARRANAGRVVDVPTAHGFCVYLRRDCLNEVGLLREDLFAQGYGEENDLCIRARHLGWRHVAAPGVFVAHAGGGSFGEAKAQLMARNLAILNRLHPGYDALIATFCQADPLAEARFRMDALRWRAARSRKGAVVLITHARTGGVKRNVAERCQAIAQTGMRPIVLSPATDSQGRVCCQLGDLSPEAYPNLRFDTTHGLTELVSFLRGDQPARVELHHFIGHDPSLFGLAPALDVPYDVVVHDYAWICPRITLVGPDKRYCGEPGPAACEACYADLGSAIDEDIPPSRLRLRSHRVLAGARQVVAPSQDTARRLARYFPGVSPIVRPWENLAALPAQPIRQIGRVRLRVAVVGAIGIDKGYEYLLACARHVATQRLPLEFIVVGYTSDDKRLLDTGVVHITGGYQEAEIDALIRAQQADIGFLPALWPETWSYTLSQMWQAGLDVMAFDLGAPAERLRATDRGGLLPLGLSPAATCQALLRYRRGAETSRSVAQAKRHQHAATPTHAVAAE
jgi:GT2 family glycosyltransferase/glycosyltransferase involved in cell wall biosynthesis